MKLSVVIPAYNEARRLPRTLKEAWAWLCAHEPEHEILVVDDGSQDNTRALAQAMQKDIPSLRVVGYADNRGKGYAVRAGMLAAKGAFRLFMDADHSTHISEWEKARALLQQGADVAIASRKLPDSEIPVRQPWLRERLGEAFNLLVRAASGLPFRDTQCGFKAFTARAAQEIFARTRINGFGFDVEVLWLAKQMGLRIAEFAVTWRNDADSRVRIARDAVRVLAEIARMKRLHKDLP